MKASLACAVALVVALFSQPSVAKDSACLIEGSFKIMGKTIYSKDCVQSDPSESEATFKSSCKKLADSAKIFGGKAGNVTYMATCPTPSQGICVGFAGGTRDAYYYARSPSDLKNLPSSCSKSGGRWKISE